MANKLKTKLLDKWSRIINYLALKMQTEITKSLIWLVNFEGSNLIDHFLG